jgi:hypothetical protein
MACHVSSEVVDGVRRTGVVGFYWETTREMIDTALFGLCAERIDRIAKFVI